MSSVNLKLVGIKTYTGAATMHGTESVVVHKGEVCRFSADVAKKVLKGARFNRENESVSYFQEVPDDAKVHHNFSGDDVEENKADIAELAAAAVRADAAKRIPIGQRARPRAVR